ncbi:hypothetical protein Pla52n_12810 [Stieleria varia]|uniref:Uncharacterized protein n=1 Tax=Stieleria varia TaxID=2528005 RepID=A0A5C6B186_9BACT|nr:hypothetical protein Pla52n_12810 [Stieleria varia]
MERRSFRTFPWTALMCAIYVFAFPASLILFDPTDMRNWIPTRSSPVLAMQLLSTIGALFSIVFITRCHRYHRSMKQSRH